MQFNSQKSLNYLTTGVEVKFEMKCQGSLPKCKIRRNKEEGHAQRTTVLKEQGSSRLHFIQ